MLPPLVALCLSQLQPQLPELLYLVARLALPCPKGIEVDAKDCPLGKLDIHNILARHPHRACPAAHLARTTFELHPS